MPTRDPEAELINVREKAAAERQAAADDKQRWAEERAEHERVQGWAFDEGQRLRAALSAAVVLLGRYAPTDRSQAQHHPRCWTDVEFYKQEREAHPKDRVWAEGEPTDRDLCDAKCPYPDARDFLDVAASWNPLDPG